MSDRDRLHAIVDSLSSDRIEALLTLLDARDTGADEEFARRLAEAAEEDLDDETARRILAAQAETGDNVSYDELNRRLGF